MSTAPPRPTQASGGGAGAILQLVRSGQATTRADLAAMTGLARSTVAQRVDALLARGLLVSRGDSPSTGGRPATLLAFNDGAGVVLCGDLGATHSRVAVTDLGGTVLAQTRHEIAIAEGPEVVLGWLEATFDGLLDEIGRGHDAVRGVGVGLPGPVEFATGRPVSPPIMPGWDRYPVGDRLATRYGVPALVDNDVNIMAVGEHWSTWRDEAFLLFVKMGTGIGSGIVAGGHVHRGADGAAGDIGHIHVPDHDDIVCRCGNRGCLEAFAGGGAMAARLREAGLDTHTSLDVVDRVRAGHPVATQLIREAGRTVGGVLATCVNMLNPAVIVIGGDLARADEPLLAGVREVVYRRSLPLATGRLRIVPSRLDDEAGVVGAAVMVIESVLAPDAVDAALIAG
ncbi:MAG TPA: ROK family transcriptional regulator [Acidimicrobiales bacterium]|nr:ROK family transcriptional regulator [Acidimicrobiales bacterium]